MNKNVNVGDKVRVNDRMSRNGHTGIVTMSFIHNDLPHLLVKFDEDGDVSLVRSQHVQLLQSAPQPLAFSQLWLAAFAMAFGVWLGFKVKSKNML
jgi:hypothetical protein